MTDQNTPELEAAASSEAGGATARPRRRRASRPAAAPELALDVTLEQATDAPTTEPTPAEPTPAEPTPEADKPVRRKRATRASASAVPSTAPDAAASTDAAAEPAAPAELVAPEREPVVAAPARRRRAATRPVAAPADAAPAEADDAAEPAPQDEQKPARKPARRRSAKKSDEAVVAEPAAEQVVASSDEDVVEDEDAEPAVEQVEEAGEPAAAPAPAEQPVQPLTPRLATTALLFQAPDPAQARPRRRRATSSAGSPEAISTAARLAQSQATPQDEATEQAAALVAEQSDDQPAETTDEQTSGQRSNRRRGRRGRGGRQDATTTDERDETTADDAEDAAGADAGADDAETTDASTTDAAGARSGRSRRGRKPAGTADTVDVADGASAQDAADEDADATSSDEDEDGQPTQRRRRRRGGRGRRRADAPGSETDGEAGPETDTTATEDGDDADDESGEGGSSRRRRRRRRGSRAGEGGESEPRRRGSDEVTALRGSTRLEAKRQRRREGRDAGRRRQIITEAEFLARREAVERSMIVRELHGRTQIAVLEDGVLVEHYVSNQQQASMVGNVYLGRVQNVLPSMEAAFVDVGKGRNAVLYAGEVNWDAAGLEGQPRRIEQALKSGDSVLVQVTKDPIGHKGARLTSQVTLAGRYLVYVPGGGMTGISRKLPDTERNRLKKILREVVPDSAGVIVRTAAEGASEDELRADIARLQAQWEAIEKKSKTASAPALLQGEPDMAIRVVRDIFNDDFSSLVVQGDEAWSTISSYIDELAPDLAQKVSKYTGTGDVFAAHRIDEQLVKGMDRKVWLPSGGSLVIDRTEAMTVVDVNTGKFTGSGGTLEETVTRNNLEAAEEIVRQLRLRDIGGIIVIDFIDMVLESNRDLVLRRLVECLGRDRTKHQVAEVTSLGLVQMTRKRVGQGLVEAFSETCEHCHGRGFIVHSDPVEKNPRPDSGAQQQPASDEPKRSRRKRGGAKEAAPAAPHAGVPVLPPERSAVTATLATIAAAAAHAHEHEHEHHDEHASEPVASEAAAAADRASAGPVVAEPVVAEPAVAEPVTAEPATAEPVAAEVTDVEGGTSVEPTIDAPAGRGEISGPELDVLAELSSLRKEPTPTESLELTPVDPSVFVTFDDDASQDDATS